MACSKKVPSTCNIGNGFIVLILFILLAICLGGCIF